MTKIANATRVLSMTPAAIAKREKRAAKGTAPALVTVTPEVETLPADDGLGYDAETLGTVDTDPVRDEPATVTPEVASFAKTFIDAIVSRQTEQVSKDLDYARNSAARTVTGINALHARPEFTATLDTLVRSVKVSDKKDARFIAVKALVKIVQAMGAIASGIRSEFDPYSQTIVANIASLQGITNKSALVCLSKSVVYDTLESQQALTRRYNCSASTASTQASSTRMMLMHLQLCDVVKGKQHDTTSAHAENARATAMLALFV